MAEAGRRGCYLTDGKRLYVVLDARESYVQLENCRTDEAAWFPVTRILGRFRVVRG